LINNRYILYLSW